MDITLEKLSKRFDTGWIFKDLDLQIRSGHKCAILGPNGSGKSTLLNILCGHLSPSKGQVLYTQGTQSIDRDDIYKHLAISAAYSELDEELNPVELYMHYKKFKKFRVNDPQEFIELVQLEKHKQKRIIDFSSGMKQRLGLGLALCMDTPLLFLDEPSSFLDDERKRWFKQMFERFTGSRTVVLASNEQSDIDLCQQSIQLTAA